MPTTEYTEQKPHLESRNLIDSYFPKAIFETGEIRLMLKRKLSMGRYEDLSLASEE